MKKFTVFGAFLLLLSQLGPHRVTGQTVTPTTDGKLPSAGECPLTSKDFAETDYASVRTACDIDSMTDATFCKSCVCGLGTAIVLGLEKAGIKVNGQRVSALAASGDIAALNNLLSNCSAVLGIELLQAGALTAQALGQLSTCDVNQSTLTCAGATPSGTVSAAPASATDASTAAAPASAAVEGGQQQHPAQPAVSAAAARAHAMPVSALLAAVVLLAAAMLN